METSCFLTVLHVRPWASKWEALRSGPSCPRMFTSFPKLHLTCIDHFFPTFTLAKVQNLKSNFRDEIILCNSPRRCPLCHCGCGFQLNCLRQSSMSSPTTSALTDRKPQLTTPL